MTQKLSRVRPLTEEEQRSMIAEMARQDDAPQQVLEAAAAAALAEADGPARLPLVAGFDEADPATWGNPGRNDPCPCGSGEKFKHCHGKLAWSAAPSRGGRRFKTWQECGRASDTGGGSPCISPRTP